jgi:signal transduction histidine kinase
MASVSGEAEKNRQRAERLLNELSISHEQLKAYATQTADLAAAEERNRLARDIHDSLGHYLTTITILLERALAFRQRNPTDAENAIIDAKRLTREALQDVRQSVGTLRHSVDTFSLAVALPKLVNTLDAETVKWEMTGDETNVPKPVLLALYRAAQEALTNVQKHAQARNISVCVSLQKHAALLLVEDDGCGFDTSLLDRLPPIREERFGLQGVRERLTMLGGELRVDSNPHKGTRVEVSIPLQMATVEMAG